MGFIFAIKVLPAIIFIASIFGILYYIGVMQIVVRFFAKLMSRFMGASGAESTWVAARSSWDRPRRRCDPAVHPGRDHSELMTIMTAAWRTPGGVMAAYVIMAKWTPSPADRGDHDRAGAIMMAKMFMPETESRRPAARRSRRAKQA